MSSVLNILWTWLMKRGWDQHDDWLSWVVTRLGNGPLYPLPQKGLFWMFHICWILSIKKSPPTGHSEGCPLSSYQFLLQPEGYAYSIISLILAGDPTYHGSEIWWWNECWWITTSQRGPIDDAESLWLIHLKPLIMSPGWSLQICSSWLYELTESEEPLLKEMCCQFVLFPIQYHKVWPLSLGCSTFIDTIMMLTVSCAWNTHTQWPGWWKGLSGSEVWGWDLQGLRQQWGCDGVRVSKNRQCHVC